MKNYDMMVRWAKSITEGESNPVPNLANLSAVIWESMEDINWAGFYLTVNGELLLGPFQGKPACIRIPWGKGVCGTAAKRGETVVVPDVHAFPGHIACDGASRSETVVPIIKDGKVVGVLDVDSPLTDRFTESEVSALEEVARIAAQVCEF